MDAMTQRVLTAQFEVPRELWKCASADCRADVSIWYNKCTACSRKRVFGQSRVRIADSDWLCSMYDTLSCVVMSGVCVLYRQLIGCVAVSAVATLRMPTRAQRATRATQRCHR